MKMTLPRFGSDEVEIDPNTLIEFPNELPGLYGCKYFKLFHSGESARVFWLQSIDAPEIVLSLTDPDLLQIFYRFTLTDEEQATLQIDAEDELQIVVVLARQMDNSISMNSPVQANFKSPIIINVSKRIALQKTLHYSEFPISTYQSLSDDMLEEDSDISYHHDNSMKARVAEEALCSFA